MRQLFRSLTVMAALLLTGGVALSQDKPRVVTVNYPLQYITERLLDGAADVVFPVPDGVDPSFWRPSIADISAVQSADLIVLNGAGFATWTTKVSLPRSKIVNTSRGITDRLIATESITHSHGDGGEHSHEGTASYTWLDPTLAIAQANAVADALKTRGLDDPASIDERLAALTSDLTALDQAARAAFDRLAQTVFVATHPRYQYLARAYGLNILSLEWEAGAMPSPDQITELRTLVEQDQASVLIWEAEPPAEARTAIAKLGLQDAVFPPLATRGDGEPLVNALESAIKTLADAAARAESG